MNLYHVTQKLQEKQMNDNNRSICIVLCTVLCSLNTFQKD